MQMYCRQAATEAERERALVSEHEETGLGGPGWGWGVGLKAQIRRFERGMFWRCCKTLHTTPTSFSPKPPPRAPFSSPPISHLMCGGCWEPHAKMNNNRLLVTIAHEHTPPLSLSLSLALALSSSFSPSLSFSVRRANSVFSVIYEHIEIPFHFSVSLSLRSPQCNIDIWAEGHTAHSSLPHCAHDPLSAWLVVLTRRQYVCVCACVFVYAWAKTTKNFLCLRFNICSGSYLQIQSMFADWDKSVENPIDCGVYWNATTQVCGSNLKKERN